MPRISLSLNEQFSDLRSNEIAYIFTITNQGPSAIYILNITRRIPENVKLLAVSDPSLVAVKSKHTRLCDELTEIVNEYLNLTSKEIQERSIQQYKDFLEETTGSMKGFFGAYLKYISGSWENSYEERLKRSRAFFYTIENKSHAEHALSFFDKDDQITKPSKDLFKAKMDQLSKIEEEMQNSPGSTSLATIEPDSIFAETYVLQFPRSLTDSRKYNIDVDVSFTEKDQPETHTNAVTKSVIISPKPYILSIIAMVSGLLGVVLKTAIEYPTTSSSSFYNEILKAFVGSPAVSAVILALVFFNVFEYTDLGKNLKLGIGWRSALLIGVLSGLLGDRILNALKGFLGT